MFLIAHLPHTLEPLLFAGAFAVMFAAIVREPRERRRSDAAPQRTDAAAPTAAGMGQTSDRRIDT